MLQSIMRSARPATRAFTTTARIMGAGDTGSVRPGGVASGDAFSKREKAQEDLSIRQREQEKLKELKEKLQAQRAALDKLEGSIDEISKGNAKK